MTVFQLQFGFNSDQCLRANEVLRRAGFVQIDFTGFVPGGGYAQTTSLFFRERIAIPTLAGYGPFRSVAQPDPPWEDC